RAEAFPCSRALTGRNEDDSGQRQHDAELLRPMHALVQEGTSKQNRHDRVKRGEDRDDADEALRQAAAKKTLPPVSRTAIEASAGSSARRARRGRRTSQAHAISIVEVRRKTNAAHR